MLIGMGRSGSSLLHRVFELHPEFQTCGETASLLFGTFAGLQLTSSAREAAEPNRGITWTRDEERIGSEVREVFERVYPSGKSFWFHKPIGLPFVRNSMFQHDDSALIKWYWSVVNGTFPDAKLFALIRHPLDVVRSSRDYWGIPETDAWEALALMSRILMAAPSGRVSFICFDDLVLNPRSTLERLFESTGVAFDEVVLGAFEQQHVATSDKEMSIRIAFRESEWESLDSRAALRKWTKPIAEVLELSGYYSAFSSELSSFHRTTNGDEEEMSQRPDPGAVLTSVKWELQRHYDSQVDQLKAWIAELEKGKQWLEGQVQNWCDALRKEKEYSASVLGKNAQQLVVFRELLAQIEQAKAWHEEHAESWRTALEDEKRFSSTLAQQVADLIQAKSWLENQWRSLNYRLQELDPLVAASGRTPK